MRLAGALTLSAGALLAASDLQRWWPDCRPGSFDTPDCARAQDPALNLVPFGPIWHPEAATAGLGGAAILLMGLAAGVLVLQLGQPWLRPCLLMFWPVPVCVVGLAVILTGLLGHPAASAQFLAAPMAAWAFTGPTAAVGLAVYSGSLVRRGWPMLLALGLASPLLAMFSLPLHSEASLRGSAPWQWTPAALGLIVAGVVVLLRRRTLGAAVVRRHRPRHVSGPAQRAARRALGGSEHTRPDLRLRIAATSRRSGSWHLATRRDVTTSERLSARSVTLVTG